MNNLEKFVRYGEILEDAINGQTAHRQSVQVTILTVSATLLALTVALYNDDTDSCYTTIALRTALVSALVSMLAAVFFLLGLSANPNRFVYNIQNERARLWKSIKDNPGFEREQASIDETVSQKQGSICVVSEYMSCAAAMIEIFALFVVAYLKFF